MAQLGALGFFLFWIVAVSGIYLFIFFDTGVIDAYTSVEAITHRQWFAGGVMRSFHRYASDLMVVVLVIHMLREFAHDRYRGARWFSWFTGVPIIWMLYASGITGYWLVWDKLAQYVAIVSSELLGLAADLRRADRPQFPGAGQPERPLLHAARLHAHRHPADSALHHVGAHPAHLASEGEPAADAGHRHAHCACWRSRCGSRP